MRGPGKEREWSKRQIGEKRWIVLCVANERKERVSCGMFTCQCMFLLWLIVSVCLCVCVTMWVSTMKYQASPYYNLTIISIRYKVSCNDMLLHVISSHNSFDTVSNVWLIKATNSHALSVRHTHLTIFTHSHTTHLRFYILKKQKVYLACSIHIFLHWTKLTTVVQSSTAIYLIRHMCLHEGVIYFRSLLYFEVLFK